MSTSKRIAIILLSLFIALPINFACIWAVGVSNALFSTDSQLVSNLSKIIIKEAPSLTDGFIEVTSITQTNESGFKASDNDSTKFLQTITGEMLKKSGMYAWMQSELSKAFEKTDRILKGKDAPSAVYINVKGLKEALTSEVFLDRFKKICESLPICTTQEIASWQNFATGSVSDTPMCYPGEQLLSATINMSVKEINNIPDEVIFIQEGNLFYIPPNLFLLLLLIPALVIAIISLIGKTDSVSFLKTYGIIILTIGAINIAFANLVKYATPKMWATMASGMNVTSKTQLDIDKMVAFAESMQNINSVIIKDLITPVIGTAVGVTILGAILLGIALTISSSKIQKTIPEKPAKTKKAKLKK